MSNHQVKPPSVCGAARRNPESTLVELIDMISHSSPVHHHFINYETDGDDGSAALQHLMRRGAGMGLLSYQTSVVR
jgi:hypothetical protein